MIFSGTQLNPGATLETDVVIAGSGAAGIPMALELAEAGISVVLLEAGTEKLRRADQALYEGHVVDPELHQPADKYRQRRLGGSTVTWGGRCVPLDPIDLERREYVPFSGWPITFEELDRYMGPANDWLEAGDYAYSSRRVFGDKVPPMIAGFESDIVSTDSLERFSRPTDLFRRYRSRLAVNENLRLIYDASVSHIALSPNGRSVDALDVTTLCGRRFRVRGSHYVLAAGGIEVPRLLLAANDVHKNGIGNHHDVVGRYYQCHIAGNVGRLEFFGNAAGIRHGYEISDEGIYCRRRLSLTEEEQRRRRLNNVVFRLHFPRIADPAHRSGVLSLLYLAKRFISYEYATRLRDGDGDSLSTWMAHARNLVLSPLETARFLLMWTRKRTFASRKFPSVILENKTNVFSLEAHGEQAPNPDSRITLSRERDALGMPRVVVDWRYSPQDVRSVCESLSVLREEFLRTGVARLTFDDMSLEKDLLRFGAYGGHHIGTTRMGENPRTSVVDADCRVHGVENLYIASSSVFPTSSQANPTLAITALALRLGDHLASALRSTAAA